MLSSYKGFSQTPTETVDPNSGDSLVCFPQRYLEFMVQDIKQGKKDKIKVEELQEAVQKRDEDYTRVRSSLNSEREVSSTLRDSITMKDDLIANLHLQNRRTRRTLTVWQVFSVVMVVLFSVK